MFTFCLSNTTLKYHIRTDIEVVSGSESVGKMATTTRFIVSPTHYGIDLEIDSGLLKSSV